MKQKLFSNKFGQTFNLRAALGVETAGKSLTAAKAVRKYRQVSYTPLNEQASIVRVAQNMPVATGMPVTDCLTVWLESPFKSWSKTRRILPAQLDALIPFALEDCFYAFMDKRLDSSGNLQVLAVATRRKNLEKLLEKLFQAGLDPVFLDHQGLALWSQSTLESPPAPQETRVILHLQSDCLTVVAGKGGQFHQAHSLTLPSGSSAADTVAINSLSQRLMRILTAEIDQTETIHWFLYASENDAETLLETLTQKLIETKKDKVSIPENSQGFLARAYGARALNEGRLFCNLRTGNLTHPLVKKWREQAAMRAALLFLLAGILLTATNLFLRFNLRQAETNIQKEITALAQQLAPDSRIPYGREIDEAQKALQAELLSKADLLSSLHSQLYPRLRLLTDLASDLGLAYEILEADQNQFQLKMIGRDWGLFESLLSKLKKQNWQAEIEAQPTLEDGQAVCVMTGKWEALKQENY